MFPRRALAGGVHINRQRALSLLALLLIGGLLFAARGVLAPFAVGMVLAYLLLPLVRSVEGLLPFGKSRPRLAQLISVITVYVTVLVLVGGGISLLVPMLVRQVTNFFTQLPDMVPSVVGVVQAWSIEARGVLPPEIMASIDNALADMVHNLAGTAQAAAVQTVGVISGTFGLLLALVSIPVWLFYVLRDRREVAAFLVNLVPENARVDAIAIAGIIDRVLGAYIRAQLLLAFIVGLATFAGLTLLNIPFALVVGLIAGITEMIPVLGPILGSVAALLVTLASVPEKALWVLVLMIVIQQVENNLLVPRIQGEAVDIHPAVIMILLVVASELGGLVGMLVAVPLAAVCKEVFIYLHRRLGEEQMER